MNNKINWNLDDSNCYKKIVEIEIDDVFTFGNTTPGKTDKDRREEIRKKFNEIYNNSLKGSCENCQWFAFRITVETSKIIDIDNVPKIIIDAFCEKQIEDDGSEYSNAGIYPDDNIRYVRVVEVGGINSDRDSMKIEIFCKIKI